MLDLLTRAIDRLITFCEEGIGLYLLGILVGLIIGFTVKSLKKKPEEE